MANKRLQTQGLILGVPGLILQASYMGLIGGESPAWMMFLPLVGLIMLSIAMGLYGKSKGYPWAVASLAILSVMGVLILVVLPDQYEEKPQEQSEPDFLREVGESAKDPKW